MKAKEVITTALIALKTNRTRTVLTVLGIIIGITAIMLVMSVGKGAEGLIVNELGGLGAETVVIRPGKEPQGPSDFAETFFADSIKERELNAILKEQNVPDLLDAAPEILVPGGVSYQGDTFKAIILGFSAQFMAEALNLQLERGALFDDQDIRSRASVVIIGSKVRDELFPHEDPIGKSITIKDRKFRVIGVFAQRGQVVFFDLDEVAVIPYTTAQTYLTGNDYYTQIVARAKDASLVDRVAYDITQTLRGLHNISDPKNDDFYVQTQQGLVDQVSTIIGIFTIFLSFVVAISLVVGGIGVMNIMLVSVAERTREIGLRKALGATDKTILYQFLLESVIITALGGLVGIILGVLLAALVSWILSSQFGLNWIFVFPTSGAALGIIVSALVGLVFGIYPARTASKKSPIEALRYE